MSKNDPSNKQIKDTSIELMNNDQTRNHKHEERKSEEDMDCSPIRNNSRKDSFDLEDVQRRDQKSSQLGSDNDRDSQHSEESNPELNNLQIDPEIEEVTILSILGIKTLEIAKFSFEEWNTDMFIALAYNLMKLENLYLEYDLATVQQVNLAKMVEILHIFSEKNLSTFSVSKPSPENKINCWYEHPNSSSSIKLNSYKRNTIFDVILHEEDQILINNYKCSEICLHIDESNFEVIDGILVISDFRSIQLHNVVLLDQIKIDGYGNSIGIQVYYDAIRIQVSELYNLNILMPQVFNDKKNTEESKENPNIPTIEFKDLSHISKAFLKLKESWKSNIGFSEDSNPANIEFEGQAKDTKDEYKPICRYIDCIISLCTSLFDQLWQYDKIFNQVPQFEVPYVSIESMLLLPTNTKIRAFIFEKDHISHFSLNSARFRVSELNLCFVLDESLIDNEHKDYSKELVQDLSKIFTDERLSEKSQRQKEWQIWKVPWVSLILNDLTSMMPFILELLDSKFMKQIKLYFANISNEKEDVEYFKNMLFNFVNQNKSLEKIWILPLETYGNENPESHTIDHFYIQVLVPKEWQPTEVDKLNNKFETPFIDMGFLKSKAISSA